MALHQHESRDVYIACTIGGLGLVFLLVWFMGGQRAQVVSAGLEPTADNYVPNAYNYNVAPYQGTGGLQYHPPANNNSACCDKCGPYRSQSQNSPGIQDFLAFV